MGGHGRSCARGASSEDQRAAPVGNKFAMGFATSPGGPHGVARQIQANWLDVVVEVEFVGVRA